MTRVDVTGTQLKPAHFGHNAKQLAVMAAIKIFSCPLASLSSQQPWPPPTWCRPSRGIMRFGARLVGEGFRQFCMLGRAVSCGYWSRLRFVSATQRLLVTNVPSSRSFSVCTRAGSAKHGHGPKRCRRRCPRAPHALATPDARDAKCCCRDDKSQGHGHGRGRPAKGGLFLLLFWYAFRF